MWPTRREGDRYRARYVCNTCCHEVGRRAPADLRQIAQVKEIKKLGFEAASKTRWWTDGILFVPDEAFNTQ
jgi:hypothetical protein